MSYGVIIFLIFKIAVSLIFTRLDHGRMPGGHRILTDARILAQEELLVVEKVDEGQDQKMDIKAMNLLIVFDMSGRVH
uniref:Uncharacterized protein n=1 Tax=Ditylenchus dipsaci TaxID=166011 RepID=A0A915CY54_9BILA